MMGVLAVCQGPWAWAQGEAPGAAQVARAKPDMVAAKKHYDDGEVKFRAGDFGGAEIDFRIANNIKATPQAERYIGRCLDALGRFQPAADWYDKFLAHAPDKMAPLAEKTRKRVLAIRAMPGKVHIESNPPGAVVTVDGKEQSAPTPVDVDLAPGSHTVALAAPGRSKVEKAIEVAFASAQTVSAHLDVESAPAPAAQAAAEPGTDTDQAPSAEAPAADAEPAAVATAPSRAPAYVTGGVAVVAAGVGAIFGIMALNDRTTFDNEPTTQNADTRNMHALIADLALGSALAFGATSAILFLTSSPAAPAPDDNSTKPPVVKGGSPKKADAAKGIRIVPAPFIGLHAGGAGLVVRF
jgi:hypothetical protein